MADQSDFNVEASFEKAAPSHRDPLGQFAHVEFHFSGSETIHVQLNQEADAATTQAAVSDAVLEYASQIYGRVFRAACLSVTGNALDAAVMSPGAHYESRIKQLNAEVEDLRRQLVVSEARGDTLKSLLDEQIAKQQRPDGDPVGG